VLGSIDSPLEEEGRDIADEGCRALEVVPIPAVVVAAAAVAVVAVEIENESAALVKILRYLEAEVLVDRQRWH
jgi:hypothetical protein